MKKMRIRIGRDGQTQIRVEGGQGDNCLSFTRAVEQALGAVEQREPLPERREEPVTVTETAQERTTL
jgi:hypothetical protein